jgi:hypothetical protein
MIENRTDEGENISGLAFPKRCSTLSTYSSQRFSVIDLHHTAMTKLARTDGQSVAQAVSGNLNAVGIYKSTQLPPLDFRLQATTGERGRSAAENLHCGFWALRTSAIRREHL